MAEARFPIKVDSNAAQVGREGAAALEALRSQLNAATNAIKDHNSVLKNLRGDSDAVKTAKKDLTDKINAEKNALSQLSLQALKAGTSLQKLNDENKKLEKASEKNAAKKLADEEKALADRTKQASDEWKSFSAVLSIGVGIALAAAAGIGKLATSILGAGNDLRKMQLDREGALGDSGDALRLGNQIDALGKKVPLARAELNKMAIDLSSAGVQGQALVDTLNAMAQANSGLAGAGDKLKEFVERGRLTQRFALNPLELQGTGLQFADVAKSLAKNTHVSIDEASQALLQGQVTLGTGAKALRDAVETRFQKVNLAKMLDLDVLKTKFTDTLTSLTKGINFEPLLKGLQDVMSLFDESNVSGKAIKELITWLGGGAVDALSGGGSTIKAFVLELEIGAIKLESKYLDLKIAWHEAFGDDLIGQIDSVAIATDAADLAMTGLNGAFNVFKSNALAIGQEIEWAKELGVWVSDSYDQIKALDWAGLGKSILEGLTAPVLSAPLKIADVGKDIVSSLKNTLGIHSPSKVLEQEVGKPAGQGIVKGTRDEAGRMTGVDAAIVGGAKQATGASGAPSSAGPVINQTINYTGNASKAEVDDLKTKVKIATVAALEEWLRAKALAPA